jgi:hypothetical protein
VDGQLAPSEPPKRHPAFIPDRKSEEYKDWQAARAATMKEAKAAAIRGPIMSVAAEEAKTALALALSATPSGKLSVPDIQQAHMAIYTRLEECWVDACAGDYLVVQSKLAVLKLLSHVCGVDAALKASKQKLTNKVNSDDAIEHMRKLGVVRADEPDTCEMPRRSVELATTPSAENPPARRP